MTHKSFTSEWQVVNGRWHEMIYFHGQAVKSFVSLNIALSHPRSLKVIRKSKWQPWIGHKSGLVFIVTTVMSVSRTVSEIFRLNGVKTADFKAEPNRNRSFLAGMWRFFSKFKNGPARWQKSANNNVITGHAGLLPLLSEATDKTSDGLKWCCPTA